MDVRTQAGATHKHITRRHDTHGRHTRAAVPDRHTPPTSTDTAPATSSTAAIGPRGLGIVSLEKVAPVAFYGAAAQQRSLWRQSYRGVWFQM